MRDDPYDSSFLNVFRFSCQKVQFLNPKPSFISAILFYVNLRALKKYFFLQIIRTTALKTPGIGLV